VRKRVETTGARVRAHHVVLAGSAHLSPLFPLVADAVLPVTAYIATTAKLGERLREAVDYPGSVVDTRAVPGYFRIVDGDRLMWGGRVGTGEATPARIARTMQRHIAKVFPQLGAVEVAHAWSGTMGFAMHRMPLIGEVSPGVWVATAFGGHGLNTTAMAGDLIARAIMDGDERWRLFASYDLVWAAGRLGLAARTATTWFKQAHAWVDEKIARRRYKARMRWQRIAAGVADEAKRNVAVQAARIAAERIEYRHAEATRLIAEEAQRLAALQAAEHAAAESHRIAEAERLAVLETERQAQADAAQRAAEEAERVAAEATRAAKDEAAALETAHAARVAAQEVEQRAVDDGEAARLAAQKVERAAKRKAARKKAQAAALKPKNGAAEAAENGSAAIEKPTRKSARKRPPAVADEAPPSAVADSAKPKRRRSKVQPQDPGS
jgi:hypothetical protein